MMRVTSFSALVVAAALGGVREKGADLLGSESVVKNVETMSEQEGLRRDGDRLAAKKSRATALPAINDFLKTHMHKEVVIFEVGACDGNFGDSNDPVQSVVSQWGIRTELVEPNPNVFPKLLENVEAYCASSHCNTHAHNYAIGKTPGTLPFFVVSPRFAKDHASAPHWAKYQLSSFSKEQILKHAPKVGLSEAEFAAYVDQADVPVLTAAKFFGDVKVAPADLDILIIDAEGFDDEVLNSFLDVEQCAPSVVVFEAKHLPAPRLAAVLARLKDRGYATDDSVGNVLALRQ